MKKIIKRLVPGFVISFITGLFYGWHGDYDTWAEAKAKCSGYDSPLILEKVKESALKVIKRQVAFERDSVVFDEVQYSFPVLSGLMWIAAQNNGRLRVLDFGGSLGGGYYQNKAFLDSLTDVKWCIVEQENFVKTGMELFSTNELLFYFSIDDCLNENKIDVILLSSVLQYLEKPYELLKEIMSKEFKYILIDRTPFIKGNDRITIQTVHPKIYKAKYPCWFFNKKNFMDFFSQQYELIIEFNALDKSNIKSEFRGMLYKLRINT